MKHIIYIIYIILLAGCAHDEPASPAPTTSVTPPVTAVDVLISPATVNQICANNTGAAVYVRCETGSATCAIQSPGVVQP